MPKQTFLNLPAEKRDSFLRIAIEEFADHDYRNASITNVVTRAGIAKGSFYQYFENKRDLYFYLVELASQEKIAILRDHEPPDPEMGLFPYVQWLLAGGVDFEFSHPKLSQIAYRAMYREAPFRDEMFARMQAAASSFYGTLLKKGIASGEIRPDLDLDLAVFLLGAIFSELGSFALKRIGVIRGAGESEAMPQINLEDLQPLFDAVLEMLQHGLAARE